PHLRNYRDRTGHLWRRPVAVPRLGCEVGHRARSGYAARFHRRPLHGRVYNSIADQRYLLQRHSALSAQPACPQAHRPAYKSGPGGARRRDDPSAPVAHMLDLQAAVHHHAQAAALRCRLARWADDIELQPERLRANLHGLLGDGWHELGAAEDIHHIHREGDVAERGVARLAQHRLLAWVHRHDAVALRLQVA